jgi:hypothetical protein
VLSAPTAPTELSVLNIVGTSMDVSYNTPDGGYLYNIYAKINDEIKATAQSYTGVATLYGLSNNVSYQRQHF